jgi:3-hydroxymyristoyl/3-hydroxydecanoyl-(acyl carrier protein) dehydratase
VTAAAFFDSLLLHLAMNQPVYLRSDLTAVYLPVKQMLQIDRVLEVTEDTIHCEMDLEQHWVFPLHFPGDPIFPACLMRLRARRSPSGRFITRSRANRGWHGSTPRFPVA